MADELHDFVKTIAAFHSVQGDKGFLIFLSGERRMRVALDRITYVSSREQGTMIYTIGRGYPTTYQLDEIAKELPPQLFFRIHPLHIVALAQVKGMEGKEVMIAGERLFTTHHYRALFTEALERRRPLVTRQHGDTLL